MLDIKRSQDRYHLETDWLSAYWHFSFDQYYDAANMAFGPLRVFNNDTIRPAKGFPMHPHRDMEIVTYVIRGELEHRDSTGGHGVIHAGEVQRMSAGSGINHSEFNPSPKESCELVQIWILPEKQGVQPSYE
jgi:redox-sensitive bicupin YhaK (pirin superfamily)